MKIPFDIWLRCVDNALTLLCGTDHACLPDMPWGKWHDAHLTPKDAARRALRRARREHFYV